MSVKINSEEKFTVQDQHLFTGCYRIPKGDAFDPYSINVAHVLKNGRIGATCDFEIKKENGEWIIVPDISKIDLQGSMKFYIIMKKLYLIGEIYVEE